MVVFVPGFGALESNTRYTALRRPPALTRLHFDRRIFPTFALYWKWMVLPANWPAIGMGRYAASAVVAVMSIAFAAALMASLRGGHTEIFFGPVWLLSRLGPLLPLIGHRSDYHLTIPAIGVAMASAQGFSRPWRTGWVWRFVAVVAVLEDHPDSAIALTGVTDDIYNDAVAHPVFLAEGVDRVYLAPEAEDSLHTAFEPQVLQSFVMEPGVLRRALLHHSAVIYSLAADHLRNMTETYRRRMLNRLPDSAPRRVEVGNPLYAFALGPEWGPIVSGSRQIPATATLRLGAPRNGRFLVLDGTYETVNPSTTMTEGANPGHPFSHLKLTLGGIVAPEIAGRDPVRRERAIRDLLAPRKRGQRVERRFPPSI